MATTTAFMAPFMLSSINVALPAISEDFQINAVLLSWVATSYLLATAVFLLPVGRFGDMHGRRRVFMIGVALFTLGALANVFSPDIWIFLASRALQGLGAAMFLTTGMAILTLAYPPQKRGRAIGILVTSVYIGLATGPFVGGLFTNNWGWKSIFMAIAFLGLASLVVTCYFLPSRWRQSNESFDHFGSLVYGLAIFFWVYGGTLIPSMIGWFCFTLGSAGLIFYGSSG